MANGNAAGDFFGLSTIDSISQYGRDLNDREKVRLALSNKREDTALAVQTRPRQQLGMGVTMDSSGKSYRSDKYGEALDEQQANKMAIAQAKLQKDAAKLAEKRTYDEAQLAEKRTYTEGLAAKKKGTPTGSAQKAYQGAEVLQRELASTIGDYDAMDVSTQQDTANPYTDVALAFLPDGVARLIQEEFIYTDPDTKKLRSNIAKIESDFSKIMAGLAVTGFEMSDRQKWSPFADGLSSDTRRQRLVSLQDNLTTEQEVFDEAYPNHILESRRPESGDVIEVDEGVKMIEPEPVQPQQSAADRIAAIKKRLSRK